MPYEAIQYFKHGEKEFEAGDEVDDATLKAIEETPFASRYVRHTNQAPSSGTLMLASTDTPSKQPIPGADLERAVSIAEENPEQPEADVLKQSAAESEGTDEALGYAEEGEGNAPPSGDEGSADAPENVKATDAALREADERGIDITTVSGTGDNGQITVTDVRKADNS